MTANPFPWMPCSSTIVERGTCTPPFPQRVVRTKGYASCQTAGRHVPHEEGSVETNNLAPARGILNALALSLAFWITAAAIAALAL